MFDPAAGQLAYVAPFAAKEENADCIYQYQTLTSILDSETCPKSIVARRVLQVKSLHQQELP